MPKYGELFSCTKCKRVFASRFNLKGHTSIKKDCTRVAFVYKGGVYRPKKTIFEKLRECGIEIAEELTIYPYKIVYDFESYFSKRSEEKIDCVKPTQIELDHVPLSAGVATDYPPHSAPVCFVREDNKGDNPLVHTVLNYINQLGIEIGECVKKQFEETLHKLNVLIAVNKKKVKKSHSDFLE